MADTNRPKDAKDRRDKGEKAVDDAIEFFEVHGEDDSPTSDSDAPAPG